MSEDRNDTAQTQNGRQAAKKAPFYAKWDLVTWKDLMATIQSFATIVALLLGGWWTYKIFVLERETSAHANVSQVVAGKFIPPRWYWLQIYVTAQNTGKSLVQFDTADIRVEQITPLPKNVQEKLEMKKNPVAPNALDLPWPTICRYARPFLISRIEAGESETAEVEFVIPAWLKTVRIYTYLQNTSTDEGWLKWLKWLIRSAQVTMDGVRSQYTISKGMTKMKRRLWRSFCLMMIGCGCAIVTACQGPPEDVTPAPSHTTPGQAQPQRPPPLPSS